MSQNKIMTTLYTQTYPKLGKRFAYGYADVLQHFKQTLAHQLTQSDTVLGP